MEVPPELANLSEEQLASLMAQLGMMDQQQKEDPDSVFVVPDPVFVVKTSKAAGGSANGKVFINLCSSDQVPPMRQTVKLDEKGEQQEGIHVPVSVGPLKQELDKAGAPCDVVDVIMHPGVIDDCERDGTGQMKRFVVDLALQYVERKHGMKLNSTFVIPKGKKYQGAVVSGQRMRKQTARAGISEVQQSSSTTASAASKTALSMLSEVGAIDGAAAGAMVPASSKSVGRAPAAASSSSSAAGSSSTSTSKPLRRGEVKPMDIRVLDPNEGDAKAGIASQLKTAAAAAAGDGGQAKSSSASSAAVLVGSAGAAASGESLLQARSTKGAPSVVSANPSQAALDSVRLAISRCPSLPVKAEVFAVVRRSNDKGEDKDKGKGKGPLAGLGFVKLASSQPIRLPVKSSRQPQHQQPQPAPGSDNESPFSLYPDEAKLWLLQLPEEQHLKAASTPAATEATSSSAGRVEEPEASAVPSGVYRVLSSSSSSSSPSSTHLVTSEELFEGDAGVGVLVTAAFVPVTASLANTKVNSNTTDLPAAPAAAPLPLAPTSLHVSLSPDKRTLVILPPSGYQTVTVDLPWPSSLSNAAASASGGDDKKKGSTRIPVRYDPVSRCLALYLPRDYSGLEASKLPPLPTEALATLLPRNAEQGATSDGAVAVTSSLPAPYLRSLLRRYAEADALNTAPEPGSRQWLLAHALADGDDEGPDQGKSSSKPAATEPPPPSSAAGAAGKTKTVNVSVPGGPARSRAVLADDDEEELPEDKFHRADALSLHFIKQKEDDKAARRQKDLEAAADKARREEQAMLEQARKQVAEEKEKGKGKQEEAGPGSPPRGTGSNVDLLPPSPASPVDVAAAHPQTLPPAPPAASPAQEQAQPSSSLRALRKNKQLVEML